VQLGEAAEGEKPKRTGLPKGTSADDISLEQALGLLSLPREIGRHPDDGEPIIAGIGRFGPYVQHGKTYANLTAGDDILNIGLNRAVTLIEEKRARGPRKGRGAAAGRLLGEHPQKGGPIVVKSGRYGPYVSHDGVNATLASDMTPDTISLEQAMGLLDARALRSATPRADKSRAPATRRSSARKHPGKAAAPAKAKPAAGERKKAASRKPS
jgi:DNA topoisomerase-1